MQTQSSVLPSCPSPFATSLSNSSSNLFKPYLDMAVWQLRHLQVSKYIQRYNVKSILDIGCAEGTLINRLSRSSSIQKMIGFDLDSEVLKKAENNIHPEMIQDSIAYQRKNPLKIQLFQWDALKPFTFIFNKFDQKQKQIELVTVIQFIEHIQEKDLEIFCQNLFGVQAKYIIITTPNGEFNVHFGFEKGQMRHPEHFFQWTRKQFEEFCEKISERYHYIYEIFGVGEHITNANYGFCSQGAFFTRCQASIAKSSSSSSQSEPKPFCSVKYPFWKDDLSSVILSTVKSLISKYNYSSPQKIAQLFNISRIGKKLLKQFQLQKAKNEGEILTVYGKWIKKRQKQQIEIQKNWEEEQDKQRRKRIGFGKEFILQVIKGTKGYGYTQERNDVWFEYESSSQDQQQYQEQQNFEGPCQNQAENGKVNGCEDQKEKEQSCSLMIQQ